MKILKLFAVIVVIAGAIFGLIKLIKEPPKTDEGSRPDPYTYKTIMQQINDLKGVQTWNNTTFDKILANIENNKQWLDDSQYRSLKHDLDNTALRRLDVMLLTEYAKQNCNGNVVKTLYNSVQHIVDKMGAAAMTLDDDKIIDRHANIYSMYGFALSAHVPAANFSFANSSWTNFETHANSVKSKAQSYRSSAIYRDFLSDKPVFVNGLSNNTITRKLNTARGNHDNKVCADIKAKYNAQPITEANRDRLNNVLTKFQREFPSSDVYNTLLNYYMDYCDKLWEQQN